MKTLLVLAILTVTSFAFAEPVKTVSGTVTLAKDLEKTIAPGGTLFIFAKAAGSAAGNGAPPLAVLRIPQPHFPVTYSLSEENAMIAGSDFKGPFAIYARYSPSGDAIDKTGPEGTVDMKMKAIKLGSKNINIELRAKK